MTATSDLHSPLSADGRFMALDGLRGVAALVVLILHISSLRHLVFHGYIAVDLFFIMSGFVVAHAYEGRLRAGWSPGAFIRARIVRLWPLYMLGTCIGAAVYAGAINDAGGVIALGVLVAAAAMMIPTPLDANSQVFTLNPPGWSLFFEMAANIVYAFAASRLSDRALKVVVGLGAAAVLVAFLMAEKGSIGQHGWSLAGGLARISFGFPLGLLLHRMWIAGRLTFRWPVALIVAVFIAMVVAPDLGRWNGLVDAVAVLFVLPFIVVAAVTARLSPRLQTAAAFIATLSYPLYILHAPFLMIAKMHFDDVPLSDVLAGAASLIAAFIAARWIEPPARAWLGRMMQQRSPAPLTA
jgi:peptidoglycan/LPS O-acetylase OafA/YrhL